MRTVLASLLLLAVSLTLNAPAQEEAALLRPTKPKIGDAITLTYHAAAKTALLRDANEITAQVMLMRDNQNPRAITLPLKREGTNWSGSFTLEEKGARLILFYFESGERRDDNGKNVWSAAVCRSDGTPVRGAYLELSSLYRSGGFLEFQHQKDLTLAKKTLEHELALYPDNTTASAMRWSIMMRETPGDSMKAVVAKEAEKACAAARNDEEALATLLPILEQVGKREKAEQIRTEAIAANPKGKIAESAALSAAYRERDPLKRAGMLENVAATFPLRKEIKDQVEGMILSSFVQAEAYEKAEQVLARMSAPDPMIYNQIAWPLIEKGEQLDKAVAWAKKGVDLLRAPDPATKPSYLTDAQWEDRRGQSLGMILDTYALGLEKTGKVEEAIATYAEAFSLTKGSQGEINERYIAALLQSGDAAKARAVSRKALTSGGSTDKVMELYKQAFVKTEGSDKGFEAEVAAVREAQQEEMRVKLRKERINTPAVDFALTGLDGKKVRLADLKGKVVVVDFWATWCGPCKASFPTLQKMYDAYRDNPRVAIYALNTWENESGQKRVDLVKKFMEDNKYSFPVLFDTTTVDKYGVTGIPTKFVIDRKGMLAFKSIGFAGADQMESELKAQLEMLLADGENP